MMKMLIKLDEDRIKTDGKYNLADLWRVIDGQFNNGCIKAVQPDGAVNMLAYVLIGGKRYAVRGDVLVEA